MKEKTVRNSNFELLRIVAMLMIIAYHIVCHCINGQLTDLHYVEQFGTGYYNQPIFYKRLLLLVACCPLGYVANAVFLLISGYFLAEKPHIDLGQTAKKLVGQLLFSNLALVLLSFLVKKFGGGMYLSLISNL